MSIYAEQEDTLILRLSDNPENTVSMEVTCYDGTTSSVVYKSKSGIKLKINCGNPKVIGTVSDLKGTKIRFIGNAFITNPPDDRIHVNHTISEVENPDNKIEYTFPDNYKGIPAYDKKDINPTFEFIVGFC
jgi:hypothetical protein